MNPELTAYVAVFGGIALFTVVLTVVAVRLRRAADAESLAMRASKVAAECKDLLVGPDFLWAVWSDTARAAAMTMIIRDPRDELISTVTVPSVPIDGLLRRFDLDGRHYEIGKASPMANRTWLREAGRATVLLSAEQGTFKTRYFQGDGENEMFTLPQTSVLKRFRPCKVGEKEIGKLIIGLEGNAFASVLTLPKNHWPRLTQVFVLANN